ncbi:MAG: type II toxin-antitoxin system RelE/ParE family toxin [Deltaproteobacteria bacterium]|jgi:toxin ParE1/3/4
MKKHQLIIADQAREDLIEIWLYIASDSIMGADKFIDFLYEKCTSLCSTPEIGRKREELLPGLRCLSAKRYLIFYRIKQNSIEIIRILSGYRDIESIF